MKTKIAVWIKKNQPTLEGVFVILALIGLFLFRKQIDPGRALIGNAADVFSIGIDQVGDEERRAAKAVNFGIVYGQTKFGLAAGLGCPEEVAQGYLTDWAASRPHAMEWFRSMEEHAIRHGWVESLIGRRRRLPILVAAGRRSAASGHACRVARNAPIQGLASDMNLWAAYQLQRYIDRNKKKWRILALIHDSIIAQVPIDEAYEYVKVSREIAQDPDLMKGFGVKIVCPMEMEHEIGFSYGECKAMSPSPKENERQIQQLWDTYRKKGYQGIVHA